MGDLKSELKMYLDQMSTQKFNEIRGFRDGNPFVIQRLVLGTGDLGTAREEGNPLIIQCALDSIVVESATDTNVNVKLSLIDDASHQIQNYKTLYVRDQARFKQQIPKIALTWAAQTGKTMTLILFSGIDFESGSSTIINSGGVSITNGDTMSQSIVAPTSTATLLKAANTSRKEISVQNQGSVDIWIGNSTVTATGSTRGIYLPAGAIISLNTTAALYGITSAGTADIHVTEFS